MITAARRSGRAPSSPPDPTPSWPGSTTGSPVILPAGSYDAWLDPEAERDELAALLAPYPEDEMEAYPVSRFVNSPSNNDPRCIEHAA